ncbi:MAG: amino acid permease [Acidobacteriota bacterium]
MTEDNSVKKLKKNLTLFDVYAISTGAMFSSGFFLLPGIAAAYTGPSVYLAYFAAGFLILPSMFSMAELSTAMPKAGGSYYFLDRSLGPLMGTVGGLGSWVAVIFKSAFALVGMGAYLAIYVDVPITALAIVLTFVFGFVNIFGAKETTLLQRVLVTTLVVILAAFVIQGLAVVGVSSLFTPDESYGEFFQSGLMGFIATIGLVFVSYAGLTKVASVAEEVENPDRNIPLGMTLSLVTATLIYTLGLMVMLAVLPPDELYRSLTPVADAGRKFLDFIPYDFGVVLIVVAAIAAFASTGNAGILSASRYPFAMAKDNLLPDHFSKIGRFGTPTTAISATVVAMAVLLLLLDVESVAKLASAFQLLLFGLISLCVIVMRESRIETYQPGFKSPLYPWLQIAGMLISFLLIIEMGLLAIVFTGIVVIACAVWYFLYANKRTQRAGAIFHVHARLGANRYEGLERELMTIIHDRTRDENLSYETLVTRSEFLDLKDASPRFDSLLDRAAGSLAARMEIGPGTIRRGFERSSAGQSLSEHVRIWYQTLDGIQQPELTVFRCREGMCLRGDDDEAVNLEQEHTLMFLVSPKSIAGLALRLAGHLAEVVQSEAFQRDWQSADSDRELRDILVRDDHFLHAPIEQIPYLAGYVDRELREVNFPGSCLVALIERDGEVITAKGKQVLRAGDELAIIGEPEDLAILRGEPS